MLKERQNLKILVNDQKVIRNGCSLCVVHGSPRSQWVPTPHGLPQGSVLAPLLCIIYTLELGPLLTDCALLGQLYADDVQAYLHCLAPDAMAAIQTMTLATGALDVI